MYAEIERQWSVISVLTRLNFVLSMFGIDEIPSGVKQIEALKTRGDTEQLVVSNPNAKGNGNIPVRPTDKPVSATASFQGAVLSTMYKEKHLQESRIKNFVVKGLSVNSHDDKRRIGRTLSNIIYTH